MNSFAQRFYGRPNVIGDHIYLVDPLTKSNYLINVDVYDRFCSWRNLVDQILVYKFHSNVVQQIWANLVYQIWSNLVYRILSNVVHQILANVVTEFEQILFTGFDSH